MHIMQAELKVGGYRDPYISSGVTVWPGSWPPRQALCST